MPEMGSAFLGPFLGNLILGTVGDRVGHGR
jgi:hypothetical protein